MALEGELYKCLSVSEDKNYPLGSIYIGRTENRQKNKLASFNNLVEHLRLKVEVLKNYEKMFREMYDEQSVFISSIISAQEGDRMKLKHLCDFASNMQKRARSIIAEFLYIKFGLITNDYQKYEEDIRHNSITLTPVEHKNWSTKFQIACRVKAFTRHSIMWLHKEADSLRLVCLYRASQEKIDNFSNILDDCDNACESVIRSIKDSMKNTCASIIQPFKLFVKNSTGWQIPQIIVDNKTLEINTSIKLFSTREEFEQGYLVTAAGGGVVAGTSTVGAGVDGVALGGDCSGVSPSVVLGGAESDVSPSSAHGAVCVGAGSGVSPSSARNIAGAGRDVSPGGASSSRDDFPRDVNEDPADDFDDSAAIANVSKLDISHYHNDDEDDTPASQDSHLSFVDTVAATWKKWWGSHDATQSKQFATDSVENMLKSQEAMIEEEELSGSNDADQSLQFESHYDERQTLSKVGAKRSKRQLDVVDMRKQTSSEPSGKRQRLVKASVDSYLSETRVPVVIDERRINYAVVSKKLNSAEFTDVEKRFYSAISNQIVNLCNSSQSSLNFVRDFFFDVDLPNEPAIKDVKLDFYGPEAKWVLWFVELTNRLSEQLSHESISKAMEQVILEYEVMGITGVEQLRDRKDAFIANVAKSYEKASANRNKVMFRMIREIGWFFVSLYLRIQMEKVTPEFFGIQLRDVDATMRDHLRYRIESSKLYHALRSATREEIGTLTLVLEAGSTADAKQRKERAIKLSLPSGSIDHKSAIEALDRAKHNLRTHGKVDYSGQLGTAKVFKTKKRIHVEQDEGDRDAEADDVNVNRDADDDVNVDRDAEIDVDGDVLATESDLKSHRAESSDLKSTFDSSNRPQFDEVEDFDPYVADDPNDGGDKPLVKDDGNIKPLTEVSLAKLQLIHRVHRFSVLKNVKKQLMKSSSFPNLKLDPNAPNIFARGQSLSKEIKLDGRFLTFTSALLFERELSRFNIQTLTVSVLRRLLTEHAHFEVLHLHSNDNYDLTIPNGLCWYNLMYQCFKLQEQNQAISNHANWVSYRLSMKNVVDRKLMIYFIETEILPVAESKLDALAEIYDIPSKGDTRTLPSEKIRKALAWIEGLGDKTYDTEPFCSESSDCWGSSLWSQHFSNIPCNMCTNLMTKDSSYCIMESSSMVPSLSFYSPYWYTYQDLEKIFHHRVPFCVNPSNHYFVLAIKSAKSRPKDLKEALTNMATQLLKIIRPDLEKIQNKERSADVIDINDDDEDESKLAEDDAAFVSRLETVTASMEREIANNHALLQEKNSKIKELEAKLKQYEG